MYKRLAPLLLLIATLATGQEIVVAAAADLSAALPQLAANYTKQTGNTVKLSFGSSGNLTNQIRNGAPFDVFLSADEEYPQQLISRGWRHEALCISTPSDALCFGCPPTPNSIPRSWK